MKAPNAEDRRFMMADLVHRMRLQEARDNREKRKVKPKGPQAPKVKVCKCGSDAWLPAEDGLPKRCAACGKKKS